MKPLRFVRRNKTPLVLFTLGLLLVGFAAWPIDYCTQEKPTLPIDCQRVFFGFLLHPDVLAAALNSVFVPMAATLGALLPLGAAILLVSLGLSILVLIYRHFDGFLVGLAVFSFIAGLYVLFAAISERRGDPSLTLLLAIALYLISIVLLVVSILRKMPAPK